MSCCWEQKTVVNTSADRRIRSPFACTDHNLNFLLVTSDFKRIYYCTYYKTAKRMRGVVRRESFCKRSELLFRPKP